MDEIEPADVRTWRTERLTATGPTQVAKAHRLLKAIMETAADDELVRRNPCRVKGAGKESPDERPVATVAQVDAVADAMGPSWRLMIYLAALRPYAPGGAGRPPPPGRQPRSARGLRHQGGEKGAPFRRTTFGRKWCKARALVGLPDDFRFYDLRHTVCMRGSCQPRPSPPPRDGAEVKFKPVR